MESKMDSSNADATDMGVAVVTGASAGIGRGYASRLAARGYDLMLVARGAVKLQEIAAALRADYDVAVDAVVADLVRAEDLERVADCISRNTRVRMLVNNVATATVAKTWDTPIDSAAAMINLNVLALVRLTLAVLPVFRKRGSGTIVNVGSILGVQWLPMCGIYSGTKAFVLNFTRALQEELAGSGIMVQLVLPAATATDLWESFGAPLSAQDPAVVMTIDDLVNAALAGLLMDERITLPSVEDASNLVAAHDALRAKLYRASRTGKAASRYKVKL
jgi:short-subunit dehydrogenase